MVRNPGRRPGSPQTREAIVRAAREAFGAVGFERATIRDIAGRADVDPALVMHYFGSKDGLFSAAMTLPIEPAAFAASVLAGGLEGAGERLVDTFLAIWENPQLADQARGILRAAVSHESAAERLRSFIEGQVVGNIAGYLGEEARTRIELAGAHLIGLAFARYILRAEPLASIPRAEVAEIVGPIIQGYLSGAMKGRGT